MMSKGIQSFRIRCDTGASGVFDAGANRVSAAVGQNISRDGTQQMWDFLVVLSQQGSDGTLRTRVLLCHPDWDDPLEIASIESTPENLEVRIGREEPVPSNRPPVTG